LSKIAPRWAEVKNKTIGNDKFPVVKPSWVDARNQRHELLDGYVTDNNQIYIKPLAVRDDLGLYVLRDGKYENPDAGGKRTLKPGINTLGIYTVGKTTVAGRTEWRYVDFKYFNVTYNPPASVTTAAGGAVVYRLQGAPAVNLVTKPAGTGISAAAKDGSAAYTYPEPSYGQVTLAANWNMPQEIAPGKNYSVPFQSAVSVGKVVKLTNMNDYPSIVTSNPFFRVITSFSSGTEVIFQYSPDDGKTWKTPLSVNDAWTRYYEPGMKQVLQPILVWPPFIKQYLPPDPSRPVPLTTPPQNSSLPFRLKPDFSGSWPDQVYIVITAEATGLSGSNGSSLSTIVYTYKK
jgi:hypothetical protein